MTAKKVKLSDIAEAVGVSVMTVSQVLNPRKSSVRVSEKTAEKISKTAKRMNYQPNLIARQLAGKDNKIIGIIIDSQAAVLWQRTLRRVEECATAKGYRIQIGLVHDSLEAIKKYIKDFQGYGIKNVICMAHNYPQFKGKVAPLFKVFPNVVFVEKPVGFSSASYVSPDYDDVFKESISYLYSLGCRRMISCDNYFVLEKALKRFYLEHDMEWNSKFQVAVKSLDRYEYAKAFIDKVLPLEPDALIVGSDESAMWCCKVLKECGLNVPDDISILSTSKWPLGEVYEPAITAIDYDYEKIAEKAVEIICKNAKGIKNSNIKQYKELISAKLIIRESCK